MTMRKAKTARKPGRMAGRKAAAQKAMVRAAGPSAAVVLVAAAAEHAHVALHIPPVPYGWMAASGIIALRGRDGLDVLMARRSGGKAAARRRKKYQGTASASEVHGKLSVHAARRRAKVTRPSLAGRIPASEAGIVIGKGGMPRRPLMGTAEDFYLVFAPPRAGKSGWMSGVVVDAPGAVVTTSTRVDVYANTSVPRSAKGPVYVLNPGCDGAIGTSLFWDPLEDCHSAAGAIQRAGYLMAAAPKDSSGKDAFWDARGHELLRIMLHAAAIGGASMREARRWVLDPFSAEPASILANPLAADGWAGELEAMIQADGEQLRGITATAAGALAWMADPHMAAVACPGSGDEFSALDFLLDRGTLYLIGTDRPHNSLAPYFACLTAHLFDTAKLIASVSPGNRLDPPLTLVLDEPAIGCPVPLVQWSAESGGHGVTLVTGFQSPSQIAGRWGEHGAQTIRDNASITLVTGGHKNPAELEALSQLCGNRDTWEHVKSPGGGKVRSPKTERLFPPERLRTLPDWQAVLLHRSARPLTVTLTPVWKRKGYQRAEPVQWQPQIEPEPLALEAGMPALEAPRTFAVAATGLPEIQE
jgi:type IV secretion system protein VirD4